MWSVSIDIVDQPCEGTPIVQNSNLDHCFSLGWILGKWLRFVTPILNSALKSVSNAPKTLLCTVTLDINDLRHDSVPAFVFEVELLIGPCAGPETLRGIDGSDLDQLLLRVSSREHVPDRN